MPGVFVEDTEIEIKEKTEVEETGHKTVGAYYSMQTVTRTDFKSTIFSYEDISVLISRLDRFGEKYYKILLFSDNESKAWQLITLSAKLNIKIRRISNEMFLVLGESQEENLLSQLSFCKLRPNAKTKVDEITINFNRLHNLHFVGENSIVVSFDEKDEATNKFVHVLSMYNYEGKLLNTFYEYSETDKVKYDYKITDNKIKIIKF
ncbi:MAG: hypothetical protein FWE53_00445 [Firmicutes bacterium]|nr:hypothetical protein [Bacillota bacterium]